MKTIRIMLSLTCIVIAAVPPYVCYARVGDGNFKNPALFLAMLAASVISFSVFSISKLIPSYEAQLVVGILGSYSALLALLFIGALAHGVGVFVETAMWTPVIMLFGIPFMTPLVGLSWVSSTLLFGLGKR